MIEIKSNAESAQELAASLNASGDALSGVASASKDEQTKLSGNDAAHQAIDTAKTKAEEIAAAIESIGTNLQTVANGFTAVDEATAASMQ
ncbi:MAG: TIGR04197 family type VII secretion effector [Streptococcus parasanguinis]|nr:TIGR04197 family type VII secretion effector [Streptococcus parasanguinis]